MNTSILGIGSIAFVLAALSALAATQTATADFVEGRIYISANSPGCGNPDEPNSIPDRIYEFDPATGNSVLFATMPDELCGLVSGLAFTPDGSRLRVSNLQQNAILEIDGDGNISTALDASDGINGPLGSNNIAYDEAGNFYVAQRGFSNTGIFKYPAAGGPPTEFAGPLEGVIDSGAMAFASDGSLYFTRNNNELLRFTGAHTGGFFDALPFGRVFTSIVGDSSGNVFALATDGLYRYATGDPNSRELLSTTAGSGSSSVTLSPDESVVYVARNNIVSSVDALTGTSTFLGIAFDDPFFSFSGGSAVFVPEPTTLVPVILGLPLLGRPRR